MKNLPWRRVVIGLLIALVLAGYVLYSEIRRTSTAFFEASAFFSYLLCTHALPAQVNCGTGDTHVSASFDPPSFRATYPLRVLFQLDGPAGRMTFIGLQETPDNAWRLLNGWQDCEDGERVELPLPDDARQREAGDAAQADAEGVNCRFSRQCSVGKEAQP